MGPICLSQLRTKAQLRCPETSEGELKSRQTPSTDKLSDLMLSPKVCPGLIPQVMLILPRDKRAVAVPSQLLVLNQHGRDQIASVGRKPSGLNSLCACCKIQCRAAIFGQRTLPCCLDLQALPMQSSLETMWLRVCLFKR